MKDIDKELSLSEAKQYAQWLLEKKMLNPQAFDNVEQLRTGIQVAISLGFKTHGEIFSAVQEMYYYNGSITIYGGLPLALVQKTGNLQSMEEFFVDDNGLKICYDNGNLKAHPAIAVCRLKRKGHSEYCEYHVTKEDLELSGGKLLPDGGWEFKKGKKQVISYTWKKYPKNMWRNRVRNIGIRALFADALKNVNIGNTGKDFTEEIEGVTKNEALDAFLPKKEDKKEIKEPLDTKNGLNEGNIEAKIEPPTVILKDSKGVVSHDELTGELTDNDVQEILKSSEKKNKKVKKGVVRK